MDFPPKSKKSTGKFNWHKIQIFMKKWGNIFRLPAAEREINKFTCDCLMMREKVKDVADACADWLARTSERHDHIWECYSIVFFDCGSSSSRSQRPFFFSFSFPFSYLNFRLFLVGFSIGVDSPRSFV
jgi:hypothetical protein